MSLQHVSLGGPAYITGSLAVVYDNASVKTFVRAILLHNTDSVSITVEINFVPNSGGSLGSASAVNRIFRVAVGANETVQLALNYPITLDTLHDAIFALAGTTSKVTITLLGDKE